MIYNYNPFGGRWKQPKTDHSLDVFWLRARLKPSDFAQNLLQDLKVTSLICSVIWIWKIQWEESWRSRLFAAGGLVLLAATQTVCFVPVIINHDNTVRPNYLIIT